MTWPFENDTSAVVRRLSDARLRHSRFRNDLIGIIIFLAAAIMAFVSSYAYNIANAYAASTAYQGIFQNLSPEDIPLLKADPRVADVGVYRSIGMTEQGNGITMGLVCSDETTMRLSNITLAEGHMPQTANALLVEKGYLDALDLNAGIGDTISVHYRSLASRQLGTKTFQITGFLQTSAENDRDRVAYNAIVSREFAQEDSPFSTGPVSAMFSVRNVAKYSNQELKELIRKIGRDHGISADNVQVNHLYIDSNNMSKETVFTVLLVGMVLIGVCSLVVYNIFFISVMNDVISFGQLRTLGTTKKQIKRMIAKEGNCLALRFIPLGCAAGGMLSFLTDRTAFQPIPSIMIVLLSGAAVFVCVRLSILKPAKIAMSVSPMEAFRYHCYDGTEKARKRRKHLTLFSLAAMNLLRNRKRSILTFASLILSGMLFVGMSSLLTSLDPVQRAKQSFPYEGDYVVELNRALVTPSFPLTQLQKDNFLTDGLKQEILSIDGVEGVVCQQEICVMLDTMETAIRSMNAEDHKVFQKQVLDGVLPEFDHTGENTLVVNLGSPELGYLQKNYEVGDTVTFSQVGSGLQDSFSYVVAAVIYDKNSASSFILPAGEMNQAVPYNANSAFVVQADGSPEIEGELYALVSVSDNLRLRTLKDMTMQYQSVFSTISAAAYALLAVVILFSIINLANTSITNILSRRKELGLFRAVGLDGKQLCQMIGIEIAFQTLGSFAASVVCGSLIGKAICSAVGNLPGFHFVDYRFPALSILFYGLLIFMLQIALAKWAGLYCRKTTVVAQLRGAE